jgi:hypothetical protein
MKRIAPWLGAVALVLSATPFARAQVRDPADLLPAQTLACVEVRHPDKLARELGLLVKGSALEDMPATMAKFRAKLPKDSNFWLREEIGMLAMFASPEMLAEAGRFQGAVFALTGVSKDKGPQWVIILLSGESNLPGFVMRTYLTMDDQVRSAGEVEGVTVYQEHHRVWEAVPPGAPPGKNEPNVVEGPALGLLPGGTLVIASSPDQVKDVIRRAKNKSNDPALSGLRAFRDTAKLRERPGLFAYADLEALANQMDAAAKSLTQVQRTEWEAFKTVVNPRAFRAATASLTLQNGNLELQAQVKTVQGQTSPLMALLPDKKADVQLMQYVPRDTVASVSLGLGDGEKRWAQIVDLLDAIAKNQGDSELNLPSKAIKEMQKEYGIDFGKDVAAKIKGAVVCGIGPENSWAPLCVVQATDATAAKYLAETAIPTLARIGDKDAAPKKQEVDGATIYSVPVPVYVPRASICYGIHGDVLVLGLDPARVAAALKCGSKKEGLVSDPKNAAAVKEVDGSVAVGVLSVSSAVVGFFRMMEQDQGGRFNKVAPPPGGPGGPPGGPPAEPKLSDRAEKASKELAKVLEPLPPVVFSMNRKEDTLVFEARLTGLKSVSTKLIDLWVDSALERQLERQRGFAVPGAVPVPPPPGAKIEEDKAAEAEARDRAEAAKQKAEAARREAEEIRRKLDEERRKEKDKDR